MCVCCSYLEEWIYHGVCSDPGLEFMIEVNGAALLRRDRTYWTSGYTLRPQASVPAMFLDVLEEAFVCGKTINLLRLCSRKVLNVHSYGSTESSSVGVCVYISLNIYTESLSMNMFLPTDATQTFIDL